MNTFVVLATAFILQAASACEHTSNLKYVNEACKDVSECYNANNKDSVLCINNLCTCNDGYISQLQWFGQKDQRLVCNYAPYENQLCTTVCQKPYQCLAINETTKPNVKTCQCRPPYIVKQGLCYLECKNDEIFENGECKKRCADDENKEIGGYCKKMGQLGATCDTKNQCTTPYSMCVDRICVCGFGFVANDKKDACVSEQRWCPTGVPIRTPDSKILECKVVKKTSSTGTSRAQRVDTDYGPIRPQTDQLTDDCGEDQFCMLTTGEGHYIEGASGHCCSKPKLECPYGVPHPNATCGDNTIPMFRGLTKPDMPYCPYGTHSCMRWSFGGSYETSLCCPTACCHQQVFSKEKNRCLPLRNFGDHCEIDDQCKGHTGVCKGGVCTCDKEYSVDGGVGYQYCRLHCSVDEVPVANNKCLPKLKLGESCDPSVPQCPNNAFCSEKKICDCYCGFVKLEDGSCAQQPTCPPVEGSKAPNYYDLVTRPVDFVLCRIPGGVKSTLSSVVESCPKGQYCSNYLAEYGICCPTPEKPFCPDGALPGNACDIKKQNDCGVGSYCNRYVSPAAETNSTAGYVCCPFQSMGDSEP